MAMLDGMLVGGLGLLASCEDVQAINTSYWVLQLLSFHSHKGG
jgi:hypothetical protein